MGGGEQLLGGDGGEQHGGADGEAEPALEGVLDAEQAEHDQGHQQVEVHFDAEGPTVQEGPVREHPKGEGM